MNSFMKLFVLFVVFSQIQIALSQPNQLIQQLCKKNRYQALCVSTLSHDPRSKTSNLLGLGTISIDATAKKVNDTLTYAISLLDKAVGRSDFERYGTCTEAYAGPVRRYLPAASANLKAKKYASAVSNLNDVITAPFICEHQWAGDCPFIGLDKEIHDLADMTINIINTFVN